MSVTLADAPVMFEMTLHFCLQFRVSLKPINLEISGRHAVSPSPPDPFHAAVGADLHSSPLFSLCLTSVF